MGQEAKMAHRLTDKVLSPTNIERVNVQLAVSAMHETTIAALEYYGQNKEYSTFNETAEYLRHIRRWFDTVNVKSASTYKRLNDNARKPITKEDRSGLIYLKEFEDVMRRWQVSFTDN